MSERTEGFEPKHEPFRYSQLGGIIETLFDSRGQAILLPRRQLESGSYRGGSHVCLPNFGPDATGQLKQHGFGRDVSWKLVSRKGNSVYLAMDADENLIPGLYHGLSATQHFNYVEDEHSGGGVFSTQLGVKNNSDHAMRLDPGFHPYLYLPEGYAELEGQTVDPISFAGTEFIHKPSSVDGKPNPVVLITRTHKIEVWGVNLERYAIWSMGDTGEEAYLCIEPTFAGARFAESTSPQADELLLPGPVCTYDYNIRWTPLD